MSKVEARGRKHRSLEWDRRLQLMWKWADKRSHLLTCLCDCTLLPSDFPLCCLVASAVTFQSHCFYDFLPLLTVHHRRAIKVPFAAPSYPALFPVQNAGQQAGNTGHWGNVWNSLQAINNGKTLNALGKEETTGRKACWNGRCASKMRPAVWKRGLGNV